MQKKENIKSLVFPKCKASCCCCCCCMTQIGATRGKASSTNFGQRFPRTKKRERRDPRFQRAGGRGPPGTWRNEREKRPEVSTGMCTRSPTAHGETRERRIYPEVSTGGVFSKIDDWYRLQPKIYRLRFMGLERESVQPSGTPGQASLQFTYLLTIYTCKWNMILLFIGKI
jgi:hypothetical protein